MHAEHFRPTHYVKSRDSPTAVGLRILPSVNSLGDELRLLVFIAVQSWVLFCCWHFVAGRITDTLQRMIDTLLLVYVVQYVAVGLPGMLGVLSPIAMLAAASIMSGLLLLTPSRGIPGIGGSEGRVPQDDTLPKSRRNLHPNSAASYQAGGPESLILLGGVLFVIGYLAAMVWTLRYYPVLSTDALTYHLPAAVQWLQHGRVDLFQTWLFNPANTYSPLAGSVFHAWLLGPIGNDTLAHFASAPMVLLLFHAVVAIARSCGASMTAAVLLGAGLALSHPIVSQVDKAKDDLFLAAFFAVAAGATSRDRLQDRLGPWRLGAAVGLCLAVKYTALLAMPMLLLAIDSPIKAKWRGRQGAIFLLCVLLLAGPWYLRNLVLTGNPLFPTALPGLRGLFTTARSYELRSFAGVMGVLLSGSFAVPGFMAITVACGWLAAVETRDKQLGSDPTKRLLLLGPPVGVAVLIAISPYPEVRFVLPSLVLTCAATGLLRGKFGLAVAILFALSAIGTGLTAELWTTLFTFCIAGVVLAGAGVGLLQLQSRHLHLKRDALLGVAALIVLMIAGFAYVNWRSFLNDRQSLAFNGREDGRAKLWQFVQDELPTGERVAYAGTFTVYPLMGFDLSRPVSYTPVQVGRKSIADLPYLGRHLTGEQIDPAAVAASYAQPDRETWLVNLRESGVAHLVVLTNDVKSPLPELAWSKSMPETFRQEYADESGVVYRILP